MAKRFPRTESDIAKLAGRVVDGLTNAAEDFPAPPVSSEELRGKLDAFRAADTATVAAARWHPVAVAGRDPGHHHRLGGRRLGHPAVEAPRGRRLARVLPDPAAAGTDPGTREGLKEMDPPSQRLVGRSQSPVHRVRRTGACMITKNRLHRKLDSPIDVALRSCAERNRSKRSTALNASYPFERRPHSSTGSHPDRVSLQ